VKRHLVAAALCLALAACTSGSEPTSSAPRPSQIEEPQVIEKDCAASATKQASGSISVRLRVSPCRVPVGVAPEAILINLGKKQVGYGPGFKLERRSPTGWRWVNRNQGFELPLFYLEPGTRSDPESLAVYFTSPEPVELKPGTYRVTKSFTLNPGTARPPSLSLRTTFEIVAPLG
jgi:hypothetical protein